GPCYYNQYSYWHGGKYIDVPAGSAYPFGFGLSYSQFSYGEPVLDKISVQCGEKVTLTVEIENVGERDGEETAQLYFRDKVCKMLTPIRALIDFKRVQIPAGKTVAVSFEIDTEKLGYYDRNCNYRVDAGEFALYVSGDGRNFKEITLRVEE
ncbi:MAG: fibronectin type III-like domain-contianing protein, partial [Clostridia bacterium]|nr:fibronectin type III-like domain-contianing protein [Clostridia bacterium]